MIRTDLSDKARAELIEFCTNNLNPGLDPVRYAEGLISECENWEGNVIFEIRGMSTASGSPATISFACDEDFSLEDIEGEN